MGYATILLIAIALICLMLATMFTQTGITLIIFGITYTATAGVVLTLSGIILLGVLVFIAIINGC